MTRVLPCLALVLLLAGGLLASGWCPTVHAQPVHAQPGPAQPALTSPELANRQGPFSLTPAEQQWLEQVLIKWEGDSSQVQNFYCDFERLVYNQFGPGNSQPFAKEKGKLGFTRPDKGSIEITESRVWTPTPQPPPTSGPTAPPSGDWKIRRDSHGQEVPGDHWVCDGMQVYEYRHHEKQLVVTPIPPEMQGKNIVDGPLPFLFGAEAAKLQQRYWFEPAAALGNETYLGLHAKPKQQTDAANFSDVWVVLRNVPNQPLMPAGIRVRHPDGSLDEYRFDLDNAQVNGTLATLLAPLFQSPRTPWGWKRVVQSDPPAQAQAPRPQQPR